MDSRPVAPFAVAVQLRPDVALLDQARQLVFLRRLDLAPVFAKLGWDPRHPQLPVYLFFSCAQDLAPVRAQEGLLAQRQPLFLRQLTQAHIVIFRSGSIYQGCAKALGRVHPQLGMDIIGVFHRRLKLALAGDPHHLGVLYEGLHHRLRIGRGCQQVQIADGGAHTAQAARRFDPLHAWNLAQ
jgi:hypothetical protein